ncbi:MAG: low molecular weight protein arginine phosphatase [Candidatus Eisenbacteria bacterium]|nr:low molecular weight protein arginine phosphatase [Candidatus Eisenbacteria bacterium]
MFTILLVCTGNTCRSPMAAGLLERLIPRTLAKSVRIESAGVDAQNGGPASRNAIEVSKRRGIDVSGHFSRRLTREIVEAADLILVMQKMHFDEVREICPSRAEHTLLLTELHKDPSADAKEIADPCGGSEEVYERCFSQIQTSLEKGMKFLLELVKSKEGSQ